MPCQQNEQLGDGPLQCEALVGVSLRGRCISIQWRNSLLPLLEHFGVKQFDLEKKAPTLLRRDDVCVDDIITVFDQILNTIAFLLISMALSWDTTR
jgi:hypothetical protein